MNVTGEITLGSVIAAVVAAAASWAAVKVSVATLRQQQHDQHADVARRLSLIEQRLGVGTSGDPHGVYMTRRECGLFDQTLRGEVHKVMEAASRLEERVEDMEGKLDRLQDAVDRGAR